MYAIKAVDDWIDMVLYEGHHSFVELLAEMKLR